MSGGLHVDRVLTDQAIAYFRNNKLAIASQAVPPVAVSRRGDRYQTWTANDMQRSEARIRADGTASAVVTAARSSATYYCDRYAAKAQIILPEMANDDDPAAYEMTKVRLASDMVLLRREQLFATAALTNTSWASTHRFVGHASSESGLNFIQFNGTAPNPILSVDRAKDLVIQYTNGYKPNVIVVTPDVHNVLRSSSAILDRIKYMGSAADPAMATEAVLAEVFGVEKYLVLYTPRATNLEGATAAVSYLSTDSMVLMYSPSSQTKYEPSAIKQFSWSEYDTAKDGGDRPTVKRWNEEAIESDWVEAEIAVDFEVTCNVAAVHFADVLA
jgi:hypothetical protein